MSEGELEMIRRISPVAVCCSRASVRERCTSAYDGAGWAPPWGCWRGVPHSPQNFIVGRFSCWHLGHVMPEPPSGRVGGSAEPFDATNCVGAARSRPQDGSPAPGPLSGLFLSQVQAPCPPSVNSALEPGDLLTVPTWHPGCFVLWPHIRRDGLVEARLTPEQFSVA